MPRIYKGPSDLGAPFVAGRTGPGGAGGGARAASAGLAGYIAPETTASQGDKMVEWCRAALISLRRDMVRFQDGIHTKCLFFHLYLSDECRYVIQ